MRYTIKDTVRGQYLEKVINGTVHRTWWCFDSGRAGKYTLARCNEILLAMQLRKQSIFHLEISPVIPATQAATQAATPEAV